MKAKRAKRVMNVTPALLRRMGLPRPDANDDKNARGRVLVVGGSVTTPGAMVLAGVATLRAGAGKLQLATVKSVTIQLGLAVPEALVFSMGDRAMLSRFAGEADAVLVGPGITNERPVAAIVRAMRDDATLVLDAAALPAIERARRGVITPHSGEMAALLGIEADEVERDARGIAFAAAQQFGCVVALKGAETFIATPGEIYRYTGGSVGLATSGSGDTLAGIIAGLAARGADPLTATLWGVWAHGTAGRRLARRVGAVGFLARELLAEVPPLLS